MDADVPKSLAVYSWMWCGLICTNAGVQSAGFICTVYVNRASKSPTMHAHSGLLFSSYDHPWITLGIRMNYSKGTKTLMDFVEDCVFVYARSIEPVVELNQTRGRKRRKAERKYEMARTRDLVMNEHLACFRSCNFLKVFYLSGKNNLEKKFI